MSADSSRDMYAIVLAAGKGTRMRSAQAKVLHEVFFAPMIHHVVGALQPLGFAETIVVTGHQHKEVEAILNGRGLSFVRQKEQLGTGDAVFSCRSALLNRQGTVLIICGDTPLITTTTLEEMLEAHLQRQASLTVMSTVVEDSRNYGRIVSNASGELLKIVEERDADASQKEIKEINAGIYLVDLALLFETLAKVGSDNAQGEVYLTDIVAIAVSAGAKVATYTCRDNSEVLGVNSRVELSLATKILRDRRNRQLMNSGVTLVDPDSTFVAPSVEVETDVTIWPHVFVSGNSVIGSGAEIRPFVTLHDSQVAPGEVVESFTGSSGKRVD